MQDTNKMNAQQIMHSVCIYYIWNIEPRCSNRFQCIASLLSHGAVLSLIIMVMGQWFYGYGNAYIKGKA